jgi:hypothetical protein
MTTRAKSSSSSSQPSHDVADADAIVRDRVSDQTKTADSAAYHATQPDPPSDEAILELFAEALRDKATTLRETVEAVIARMVGHV